MDTTFKDSWKNLVKPHVGTQAEQIELLKNHENERFLFSWNELVIGVLSINAGKWVFEYSEEYRNRDDLRPVANFVDKNKIYISDTLWPFFFNRIPTPNQPIVQRHFERTGEVFNTADQVEMLRRFGIRTIDNPFVLEAA
ncbi:MAG: hypothetical protein V4543_12100 [Bacteroidota bacterium]